MTDRFEWGGWVKQAQVCTSTKERVPYCGCIDVRKSSAVGGMAGWPGGCK